MEVYVSVGVVGCAYGIQAIGVSLRVCCSRTCMLWKAVNMRLPCKPTWVLGSSFGRRTV